MFRWAWVLLILGMSVQAEDADIPDPDWNVARAQFATAIRNREPVDDVVLLAPPVNEVYFFTDLRHLQERTVTHRWEFNGRVVSIVPFEVKGPRWRVFSKIEIEPDQLGEWSVTVVDESGWPLHTELFRYAATEAEAEAAGKPATRQILPGSPSAGKNPAPADFPVSE